MTEQEYKEICAEVQNSGIPKQSQEVIIDVCGKQVEGIWIENRIWIGCPSCGTEYEDCDNDASNWNYCPCCGKKLKR